MLTLQLIVALQFHLPLQLLLAPPLQPLLKLLVVLQVQLPIQLLSALPVFFQWLGT